MRKLTMEEQEKLLPFVKNGPLVKLAKKVIASNTGLGFSLARMTDRRLLNELVVAIALGEPLTDEAQKYVTGWWYDGNPVKREFFEGLNKLSQTFTLTP